MLSGMQALQGGSIGITLDTPWAEPLSDSPQDLEAAERLRLFIVGWWVVNHLGYW